MLSCELVRGWGEGLRLVKKGEKINEEDIRCVYGKMILLTLSGLI